MDRVSCVSSFVLDRVNVFLVPFYRVPVTVDTTFRSVPNTAPDPYPSSVPLPHHVPSCVCLLLIPSVPSNGCPTLSFPILLDTNPQSVHRSIGDI